MGLINLTVKDIVVPTHCPVFGFLLSTNPIRRRDNSPSLDRIIPELGYVRGNVMVISLLANMIKSSGTPEQIQAVATWLREVYPSWLLTGS